jgi:DNA end-binding protein Ku
MARAIWKGVLNLGDARLNVKFYAAVEDRSVHFHLLHKSDRAPVEQHIVRKDTGKEVERQDIRKAFALTGDTAVILEPDEIEALQPKESRDIELCRFVTPDALGDQWYDRPYYLGPDGQPDDYFAMADALAQTKLVGIARWVMRKKRYLGALVAFDGYLTISTLRRADQVLTFSRVSPAASAAPTASELKLAEQLVTSIEADFEPQQWQNEYRKRLCALIEAKARGEKPQPHRPKRKPRQASLADSLKASLAAVQERKVA